MRSRRDIRLPFRISFCLFKTSENKISKSFIFEYHVVKSLTRGRILPNNADFSDTCVHCKANSSGRNNPSSAVLQALICQRFGCIGNVSSANVGNAQKRYISTVVVGIICRWGTTRASLLNKLSQLTLFPSGYPDWTTPSWEQRKFSDLTDRVSIQSSDSDLPQVEYEDIVSGEGTLNKDLHDKEGGKTGIKFYAGDVLYGKLRPYLMNWLYPQFNGVAVGDFWVLRATECDSSFLYRLVQTDSFQRLANVSTGSKMPRADWNLISQSFFAVPADYAEQKAIAKSLAELDSLITLHQRK